jgi:hypothetical protein
MKTSLLIITLVGSGFLVTAKAVLADETNQNSISTNRSSSGTELPFIVTVVEGEEARERSDITNKAVALLDAKDYDKLDEFAAKLRSSKEAWATGQWKLQEFYSSFVPRKVSDPVFEAQLGALHNWVNARTNSITARLALADCLVQYAWNARGSGWANTVTSENWRLFAQRLNQAVQLLNEAKRLPEQCPVYWSIRMRAALGLQASKIESDKIFKEAKDSVPDYHDIYIRRATDLLPRWNGSPGEWEVDLTKSADQIGGEKGDMLYAQVTWYMHHSYSSTNVFKEYNVSWSRANRGFDVIETQFPDSLDAKSERAKLATLAGDRNTARESFEKLNGQVVLNIWRTETNFVRFARWAYAKKRSP